MCVVFDKGYDMFTSLSNLLVRIYLFEFILILVCLKASFVFPLLMALIVVGGYVHGMQLHI